MLLEAKGSLDGWENNLAHLKIDRTAGDAALIAMTHNVSARLEVKARKSKLLRIDFRSERISSIV